MELDTLYDAAIAGDADAIAKLELESDTFNGDLETILHTESINGNTERVLFILRQFAHKNLLFQLDIQKNTALIWAAYHGRTEVAEVLINAAKNLYSSSIFPYVCFQTYLRHADCWSSTALHLAAQKGHASIVKLLVEADPSDRHIQNELGKTPMYLAAEEGYHHVAEIICATCSAPSLDGPRRSTALHAALYPAFQNVDKAKEKEEDMIRMIIIAAKRSSTPQDVNFKALFNRTDESGHTVFELAVTGNYVKVVDLMLKEDPSCQHGVQGRSDYLMRLISVAMDEEYKDIVELLSSAYEAGGQKGAAALIIAIKRRDKASVLHLLDENKHLANFAEEDQGWTPLHYAAYHEFDYILDAIIGAQNDVGHKFMYPDLTTTPFHIAAQRGYTSTLIQLIQLWPTWSSEYTAVDEDGQNILHLAAYENKKEMIQGILKYCPENHMDKISNKQDANGDTPLHILVTGGCFIPELIKHKGLNLMIKNNKNWTPRDLLYLEEQIIARQDQIKIALDDVQTNREKDILESLVRPSTRETKDAWFKSEMHHRNARMKEHLEIYKRTRAVAHWLADAIVGDAYARSALELEAERLNQEEETILHVESKKGDIERVQFIVREFSNKNLLVKRDRLKQTALHLAAHHGHTQVVEVLIDAGRNLPSSSASDDTHNPVSSFKSFIRQVTIPMRNTALHVAVLNGNVAIVKLLIEADPSDRHIQNYEGKSPIYIAAEKGYKDIIKEICTTCTAQSLEGPGGSTTALHALIKNIQETKEWGYEVGMIIDAVKRWNSEDTSSFKALFNKTDEFGSTVLQLAVERNSVGVVKLLLEEDPSYQNSSGINRNGLMRLIYKAIHNENSKDIVKVLCETYEAGINPDHKGVLTLILAIKRRDKDSVLDLLKDGKHLVLFAEAEGWTPLHYAAYHEFVSILDPIIEAQKDVGYQFVYGDMVSTPFHIAVENGYTSTVIQLMKLWPSSSCAYTAVNQNGQNILHLAAGKNKKKIVQGILKYCPEKYKNKFLQQQDVNGDTPLHLLISNGCFISELIEHKGLNTMAKNKKSWTPRDMLYFSDDIIGEQVKIKIALDAVQTVWSRKFWRKSIKKDTDIIESSVLPSKRETKDLIFDKYTKILTDEKNAQMKKDLERYKKRTNTQIVVSALITTVTFTVGFTMPGGLHQSGETEEGLVIFSKKTAFNAFIVSDALALLLSTCSLFLYFLESMYEDLRQVSKLNAASTGLNIVSVMAMMFTFITGTYVVLSHTPTIAITVCLIGSFFFLFVIVLLIKMVYDRQAKSNED